VDKLIVTVAALAGGLLALLALKRLATLGDRKWSARRSRLGAATPPYIPARRWWADEHERPY
jgi:hypothetical protein